MATAYPQAFFGNDVVPLAQASLSITSSAVLYGLSVYTVFPVCVTTRGLAAFRLQDHFSRLIQSARIIGIDSFEKEWGLAAFTDALQRTLHANAVTKDVFVRATVHVSAEIAGTRSRGLPTTLSMFMYEPTPILPTNGARLKTSSWQRVPDTAIPSRAKVNGAYVNSVLGKQEALDAGYDDCIFLDAQGHVCELSAANIFLVRDGTLITPGVGSDLLEGVNRRTILEIARDLHIPVVERPVDRTELYVASEVFAVGTSAFVASVAEIDGRAIGSGTLGPVAEKVRAAHTRVLHGADPVYAHYLTPLV